MQKNKGFISILIAGIIALVSIVSVGAYLSSDDFQNSKVVGSTVQPLPVRNFLGLTDTPNSYSGQANKVVSVNGAGNALVFSAASSGGTWGSITGTLSSQTDLQTALDAKQPLDSDLTTIAGLTATTDNFLQSKAGAWASRTIAQVKSDLGLTGTNSGDQTTAGTTNRISVTNGSTSPVIDISGSYVGQSSITTLGTIATGVWNGTAIANANLANSTISGVALGGTLANLTATDTSLTFSGTYTGNTARTIGLNVGNANTWTGKQTFNTTAPRFGTITGSTQCLHVDTNGDLTGTGSDCGAGGSGLTVGTTSIASGTTTRVLYDNAGTLGEYTVSGSGNVAMTTSPVFTTPTLGVASATTVNKVTLTAPATGSTLTIIDGKTLTENKTMSFTAADDTGVYTFPTGTKTLLATDGAGTSLTGIPYTITGTANQVIASAGTGNITLSLPQSIATGSSPQFSTLELGAASDTTLARVGAGQISVEGVNVVTISSSDTLTNKTLTTPVINGTITGTGQATAATASTIMMRDSSGNAAVNNIGTAFTTTATAGGTTTLTITATGTQVFTGSSAQTVKLPTTGVIQGQRYQVINQSTGAVTVQSSGANTITILAANTSSLFTAVVATPTTAANWSSIYSGQIIASGKSLSVSNILTLAGTDNSTLNIGAGGTLGSAAFTASSAYEVPLTFSTGLTRSTNTITVNNSQNIATLSNLTSNGLVTTSGSAGTLGITAMGTGVATFLGTPSSANFAAAITDETGTGKVVLGTSPDFTTGITLGGVAVDTISSTASLTNKTLTSSTNVLGGVTMTLGSDADGDIYYRSGGVLTRLPKGTGLQMLRMNAGATAPEWATVNIPTVPFFQQQIPMGATGTVPTVVTAAGSNSDGSLLFTMDDAFNPPGLYRWARDTNTGMYQATHMVQVTSGGGGAITLQHTIIVIGSFVYVCFDGGTNVSCERFAIADLTGEASMSFGTVIAATGSASVSGWTDGTNIYLISSTAATTTRISSISGTSFTQTGTATAVANLVSKENVSFWDGTSAYVSQSNGVNNDDTLNKLTNVNGSTVSTSVLNQRGKTYGSSDEGSALVIASIDSNKMYYGYAATQFNATVVISLLQQLIPVTKP